MRPNSPLLRLGIVMAIFGLAVVVYMLRPAADAVLTGTEGPNSVETQTQAGLPRLLDLGADKCVPCKLMAPILAELKIEFAEVFAVEFVDVWKNPDAAKPYDLKVIPTQIFYDADGKELFRHEGFMGRDDILAKWQEFGVGLPGDSN